MDDKFSSTREESISVLRSILWQDDSLNTVKAMRRRLKELEECLKFRIRFCDCEAGIPCQHKCECWYENEYFEYIDNNDSSNIDVHLLDRICNRIRNGRCEHLDKWTENQHGDIRSGQNSSDKDLSSLACRFTSISYIHVAAAVGNLPVVKYLCKLRSDYSTLRTSCGFVALHIAVCKQQAETLKFLKTRNAVNERGQKRLFFKKKHKSRLLFDCNLNLFESHGDQDETSRPINIVKRSKLTRKLEKIELGLYSLKSPLASMLTCIEHPKKRLLLEICDLLEPKQLQDIIIHFLINYEEDCAVCIYREISKQKLSHAVQVACVLTDSDKFLLEMHHAGEDCLLPKLKYCLADLANAVRSYRCLGLMQDKIIPQAQSLDWTYCSNAPHFHVLILYGIRASMYIGIGFFLRYFDNIKLKGHDINKQDIEGMTPLHMLLNQRVDCVVHESIRVSFVQKLLELGACVNRANKQGRTPIFHWIMESLQKSGTGSRQIIKLLLYYNSATCRNINLIYYAHLIDKKVHRVTRTIKVLDKSTENYQRKECLFFTFSRSLFATLHVLGFFMDKASTSEVNREIAQMWPVFYREVYTQPRSLKFCCRLIIRRTYPCNKLIKMIENNLIPSGIKQFILAEDLLDIMPDM